MIAKQDAETVIMIIDDNEIDAWLLEQILGGLKARHKLIKYRSVVDAINFLKTASNNNEIPRLILLELHFPVSDGFNFLDQFDKLELPSNPAICILTTMIQPVDTEKLKRYKHVKKQLMKPLTTGSLTELLK